jgi:hypothetical protein
MNWVMSMFSGMMQIITYSNLYYVKTTLQKSPVLYTEFDSFTKSAWILKPLLGYTSDCFFPFRYRMKSYIFFMSLAMTLICLSLFFLEPGYHLFTLGVFGVYFCVGFVDCLAEGMTALITKMESRLEELLPAEEKVEEIESDKNKRAIGNYLMFKMFVRTIGIFSGGILADKVRIGVIYLILSVFPFVLCLWTLFVFKEEKKKVVFVGWKKFCFDLFRVIKAIFQCKIILPMIYVIMMYACPYLGDGINYMLVNLGNWTYIDLSWNYLPFGICYSLIMIFLINKVKGLTFEKLMVFGAISMNFSKMSNLPVLFTRTVSYFWMFQDQWVGCIPQYFASDMPMIATIGKFTKLCPDGLESTGITLLVSLSGVGSLMGGLLGAFELDRFQVRNGYYERMYWPVFLNWVYAIVMVLLCPLLGRDF